jgi:transcription termination/antitermination protein NusA
MSDIRIKDLVISLSNERDLDLETVYTLVEESLAAVTEKQSTEPVLIKVEIDRATDQYETFRQWLVVADDIDWKTALDEEGEPLEPTRCMLLSEAQELDAELEVGMIVQQAIESISFGRIAAQQARQVIMQKVRAAERIKISERYAERVGELMIGVVKRVTREFIILDMGNHVEAVLDRNDALPREGFHMSDRVRAILTEVRAESRGPILKMSRIVPEMLMELFKIEVPEIGEGVIEIRSAARDPGWRAKIAVKTNDKRIDPVGACVGMRGARVQAVSNELKGERVDIALWDDSPVQMVINAMSPAEVASIVVDEDAHSMDIAVIEEELAQAIGRNGQNVRLASELTGWTLNVMTEAEAVHKHKVESQTNVAALVDALDIDAEMAGLLVDDGFITSDSIAYVDLAELAAIDGFDSDLAGQLQERAKQIVSERDEAEKQAIENAKPADDMLEVPGLDLLTAKTLASKGIITRDDLAELAVDELQELLPLDDAAAAKLIMDARAHWFADE